MPLTSGSAAPCSGRGRRTNGASRRTDDKTGTRATVGQYFAHVSCAHSYTPRRAVSAVTEKMEENRASCSLDARAFIVSCGYNDVVGVVIPPQALAHCGKRKGNPSVVLPGSYVLAPARRGRKWCQFQAGFRFQEAVGTVESRPQRPAAGWRFSVALLLSEGDPRAAQPTGKSYCANGDACPSA